MEMFFFRHAEFERLYRCDYNVDTIPLAARQHPKVGGVLMTAAIILELLYIPCLISINKMAKTSACYKLMQYIGVVDLLVLPLNGILTGYMAMRGFVFCSHPLLIYFAGSIALGLYCSVSLASVLLAFNRCIEMIYPQLNEVIFPPESIKYWLLIPTAYGAYFTFFTAPVIFTGLHMSWFFSPHVGYNDTIGGLYENPLHTFNNVVEPASLLTMYTFFCIAIAIRSSRRSAQPVARGGAKQRSQLRTFIQVAMISAVNTMACIIYVFMNFVPLTEFVIILGQFGWLGIHGLPPVIYLTLNRTIRRDTLKMLTCGRLSKTKVGVMTSETRGPQTNAPEVEDDAI